MQRFVRESNSIFVLTKNACSRNTYKPLPSVIAEGIESDELRMILHLTGCRWGQGFLFSPGLDPGNFSAYLRQVGLHPMENP